MDEWVSSTTPTSHCGQTDSSTIQGSSTRFSPCARCGGGGGTRSPAAWPRWPALPPAWGAGCGWVDGYGERRAEWMMDRDGVRLRRRSWPLACVLPIQRIQAFPPSIIPPHRTHPNPSHPHANPSEKVSSQHPSNRPAMATSNAGTRQRTCEKMPRTTKSSRAGTMRSSAWYTASAIYPDPEESGGGGVCGGGRLRGGVWISNRTESNRCGYFFLVSATGCVLLRMSKVIVWVVSKGWSTSQAAASVDRVPPPKQAILSHQPRRGRYPPEPPIDVFCCRRWSLGYSRARPAITPN